MTPEERWQLIEGWILKHEERHGRMEEAIARHEERLARHEERLSRAIRLAVEEGRRERVKRRELDEKITQVVAAQLVTEEKMQKLEASLQAYLDSLRHSGNGHSA